MQRILMWKRCFSLEDAHAPVTAKPFFEKRGCSVIRKRAERSGISLTNFAME